MCVLREIRNSLWVLTENVMLWPFSKFHFVTKMLSGVAICFYENSGEQIVKSKNHHLEVLPMCQVLLPCYSLSSEKPFQASIPKTLFFK